MGKVLVFGVLFSSMAACGGGDAAKSPVSFKHDVIPIFKRSCSLGSSCHGLPNGQGGLLLNTSDPKKTHEAIVDVASGELPTMPYVTPGDASKSFLMHKLDGTQAQFDAQCIDKSCKALMPLGSDGLEAADKETLRRWIADGALDN